MITYMDDTAIPLTTTRYPQNATISQSEFDALETTVTSNGVAIALNGTNISTAQSNIATNASGVSQNSGNITTNTTAIAGNDTDIAANVTALAGKQATLSWSSVSDNDTNPVQSKDIKSYVDANAGGSSGAGLSANTFTGTQTIQPSSGSAVL